MSRALTVIASSPSASPERCPAHAKVRASLIDAQVAGQTGARRGLRGGKPVRDAAQSAYLEAEWRGRDDRRLPAGALSKVLL